jgi:hypothetical protein
VQNVVYSNPSFNFFHATLAAAPLRLERCEIYTLMTCGMRLALAEYIR